MRARTTAAAMALGLITTAWLLEHLSLARIPRLDRFVREEPVHLVAHTLLYGALAVALARWWLPPAVLAATRRTRASRAFGAATARESAPILATATDPHPRLTGIAMEGAVRAALNQMETYCAPAPRRGRRR